MEANIRYAYSRFLDKTEQFCRIVMKDLLSIFYNKPWKKNKREIFP